MQTWWEYVQELIGDDSVTEAGRKAGFDKSAFTRWKGGANADPAFVVKLVRAYDGNVLQALVIAGLISEQEAKLTTITPGVGEALMSASAREISDEIYRRLSEAANGDSGNAEITQLPRLSVVADIKAAKKNDGRRKQFEHHEDGV